MFDQDNTIDFPAPPPSPVGPNRRSFFTNDEILTDFLEHPLSVPDLILPDRVFPCQVTIQSPPIIDFQLLTSSENDSIIKIIRDSISRTGSFQIVNHRIGRGERREALGASEGVFELGPGEKREVKREIGEREFGFEDANDSEEMSEEFVWGRDERLRLEMGRIWPGYSNFSGKIEPLSLELEKIAHEILLALEKYCNITPQFENRINSKAKNSGSMCYIQKQSPYLGGNEWENSIKYEVIKMLIRGSDYYSHTLALHLCDGCSEFHIYSKKGWVSFVPDEDALVVTVGDQIQAWSNGDYKNNVGRPICKGENKFFISMAFLYSPNASSQTSLEKSISIGQQVLIAILFTFVYHFWIYVCKR